MRQWHLLSVLVALAGHSVMPGPLFANVTLADKAVSTLTAKGQAAYVAGNFAQAEAAYIQAAKTAEGCSAKTLVIALSNLGSVYREERKFSAAEETFKRAVSLGPKLGAESREILSLTMHQYALLLRKMKRTSEADQMDVLAEKTSGTAGNMTSPVVLKRLSGKPGAKPIEVSVPDSADNTDTKALSNPDEIKLLLVKHPDDLRLWMALTRTYYKAKDYANAADAAKTLVQKFPEEEIGFRVCASSLIKVGRESEAAEVLKRGIQHHKIPELYLALASLYASLGEFDKRLEVDEEFVSLFPDHPEVASVESQIKYYKKDYAKLRNASPTARESSERRWPRGAMPLKVYIHDRDSEHTFGPSKVDTDVTAGSSSSLIERAFSEWAQGSGGLLSFSFVSNPQQANIECIWTDDASRLHNEFAAGETQYTVENGTPKAKCYLLTVDDRTRKPISKEDFYETCLHEIGHAVGLSHSSSPEDVMFPSGNSTLKTTLAQGDRDRILRMYTSQDR